MDFKSTINSYADKFIHWAVETIPFIIVFTLVYLVTLYLCRFFLKRLKKVLLEKNPETDEVKKSESEKRLTTLMSILSQVVTLVFSVIFFITLLSKFGFDIGPILASAGVVGLAVGFGAQELVRDFISGFFILVENQVRTGDVAIINGTGGLVEKIELRTITLRDFNGTVHIFQNGKINTLSNMTMDWSASVFDVEVSYHSDADKVTKVLKEIAESMKNDPAYKDLIIGDFETYGIDKFGENSIVIKARLKTKPIHQWTVGRAFNDRIRKAFDKEGIEIPFPQRTISLDKSFDLSLFQK